MNAAIISIGTELVSGNTVNTNASWMAGFLLDIGIRTDRIISIGDTHTEILTVLKECEGKYSPILVTGGLGPTHDDITKQAVAEYFDCRMRYFPDVMQRIERLFRERGIPMAKVNRSQANLPEGATIVENKQGTAQGMKFHRKGSDFYFMPGVPYEMKAMLENQIRPELERGADRGQVIRTAHVTGINESALFARLEPWIERYNNIQISFLPRFTHIDIVLRAGKNAAERVPSALTELQHDLGTLIYAFDGERLEDRIGRQLLAQKLTLATAESCTGGLVAHRITNVAGSSRYFLAGATSYSNESKMKLLNVNPETLQKYGAVSAQTALEMAEGVRQVIGSDIGLSSTGIAGPAGGSREKPVGTVFIGLVMEGVAEAYRFTYIWDRQKNKEKFAQAALNQLRLMLTERIA